MRELLSKGRVRAGTQANILLYGENYTLNGDNLIANCKSINHKDKTCV